MTKQPSALKQRPNSYPKTLYRLCRWHYLKLVSRGWIDRVMAIDPSKITHGQTPESQFPPRKFVGGYQDGDWDLQLLQVQDHPLFQSYEKHFQQGVSWENTPFYQSALDLISQGKAFRGEYYNTEAVRRRFEKCDALYETIKKHGYKSNHQLYSEGMTDNILDLMDEVTVNIGRNGNIILNDGWHRFATVRMLGITEITARVCAVHPHSTV